MFIRVWIYKFLKALTYSTTWVLLLIGFVLGVLTVLLAPGPGQLVERQPNPWQEVFFEALVDTSGEINGGQQDEIDDEAAPTSDSPTTYETQPGDSMWKIAEDHYGDGHLYGLIASANSLENPSLLLVGQELILPYLGESDTDLVDQDTSLYQVVAGDSLSQIAAEHLGDPSLWPALYQTNLSTVGENPNLIYPGQWLVIDPDLSSDQFSRVEKD